MKLIKPKFEILSQQDGIEGIYKQIELAGRTCYKSEDKITENSAKDFVDRMIALKHYAVLEQGTVYLLFSECRYHRPDQEFIDKYERNPYSKVVCIGADDDLVKVTPKGKRIYKGDITELIHAISTNMRVLLENGWLDDLKYLCEPTEFHEKRIAVRFTTDRGVSHELVRQRRFSFAQESTRYCNYSKNKFNNELTFIIPSWWKDEAGNNAEAEFCNTLQYAEEQYLYLLNEGWKPQQARQALPNALKTELVMTGFTSDWEHLFRLRTSIIAETGKPHPDMSNLCDPLYKEFIKRGYIKEIVE